MCQTIVYIVKYILDKVIHLHKLHKVISDIVVVNDFGQKELTAGSYRKFVPTDCVVLFTQCSPYSLGGRLFFARASLAEKT